MLGEAAGVKVGEADIAKWTAGASHLLGVLFPYTPWAFQASSVTPGSSKGPVSLIRSTQQESTVYPPRTRCWGCGHKSRSSPFLAWGKQTARVRPGRGCARLRSQRAALVSLQGCGPDDVHYVLPSGHLRPPGHLHQLLGSDRSVSFVRHPHHPLELWGGVGPLSGVRGLSCKGEQGLNASPVYVLCVCSVCPCV